MLSLFEPFQYTRFEVSTVETLVNADNLSSNSISELRRSSLAFGRISCNANGCLFAVTNM